MNKIFSKDSMNLREAKSNIWFLEIEGWYEKSKSDILLIKGKLEIAKLISAALFSLKSISWFVSSKRISTNDKVLWEIVFFFLLSWS